MIKGNEEFESSLRPQACQKPAFRFGFRSWAATGWTDRHQTRSSFVVIALAAKAA